MVQNPANLPMDNLLVRSYGPQDQAAVVWLYTEGLLTGQITPNDTGADIENIEEAYLREPVNHFWVAELDQRIVGMIGVARDEGSVAEIRRLRVDKGAQQTSIAMRLVETALAHCKHHGFLKVVLDTRFEREEALGIFERFGFQHNRTRNIQGKDQIEFYLNIYRGPERNQHA